MGKLLRIILLQLLLIAGLVTAGGPLPVDDARHAVSTASISHCLDCPAVAAEDAADCCIQVHQGCSSCASIHQNPLVAHISSDQTGFSEPASHRLLLAHAPLKPPPRRVA